MVLGDWGFRAKHIPGSLNIPAPELAVAQDGGTLPKGVKW